MRDRKNPRNFGSYIFKMLLEEKRQQPNALKIANRANVISVIALIVTGVHLYYQFFHRPNNLVVVAEPIAFKASFDTLFVPLTFVNDGKKTNSILSVSLFQTSDSTRETGRYVAQKDAEGKATSLVISPGEIKKLELSSRITQESKRYIWLGFVTVTEDACKVEKIYCIGYYSTPSRGFSAPRWYMLNLLEEEQKELTLGELDSPTRL